MDVDHTVSEQAKTWLVAAIPASLLAIGGWLWQLRDFARRIARLETWRDKVTDTLGSHAEQLARTEVAANLVLRDEHPLIRPRRTEAPAGHEPDDTPS